MPSLLLTLPAAIPSPSVDVLEIGPLTLRLYGLCIAVGVIAAVIISSRRWEARGGDPDDIGTLALWCVPAGVIGARMYHVATDWNRLYADDPMAAFDITNGGLGIPGGVALGVLVGLVVVKVKKLPALPLLDVVAPAIPVAQAIGRLGNWFNQELFGRPTDLPWGLKVDPEVAIEAGYPPGTTFHPTFLYEALWNLALAGTLVLVDRKKWLRPGELFACYVMGYGFGRLWVESLRIDTATEIAGLRVNTWLSLVLIVGGAAAIAIGRLRARGRTEPADAGALGADEGEAEEGTADAEVPAGTPAAAAAVDAEGSPEAPDPEAAPPPDDDLS